MTVQTIPALTMTRTIAADRARVFEAWTSKAHMERWCCPDPTAAVRVDLDVRPGGHFTMYMDVEGGPYTAFGTYKEVDPPNRLVYTWDWKEEAHAMGVETLVTVEFTEVEGGTEVRLTHEGFPVEEARTGHSEGWNACLERLVSLFG